MLSANELRVNNLIDSNGEIFIIKSIILSNINNRYLLQLWNVKESDTEVLLYIEKSKPIKMAEEWLLKLGGIQFYTNKVLTHYRFGLYFVRIDGLGGFDLELGKGLSIQLDYVHNFQNLYFALTQKELELC